MAVLVPATYGSGTGAAKLWHIWKCQYTFRASSKKALYWAAMAAPFGYFACSVGLSDAHDPHPSRIS